MSTERSPVWRSFEQAVAEFLQALDPGAKVAHDVQTPDSDTGEPRQRDVWIETTFGGHLPIKILVSCKRTKRRISQQDMDAFYGELSSSGANKGVLYAFSGFTKQALIKAQRKEISCCRLYDDQAPDIPDILAFSSLCRKEQVKLSVSGLSNTSAITIGDIFDAPVLDHQNDSRALATLLRMYDENREVARLGIAGPTLPSWSAFLNVPVSNRQIRLGLISAWATYRARTEYCLVNGSYSILNKDFKGTQTTPGIDTQGTHPGPGWERVVGADAQNNTLCIYLFGGEIEQNLRQALGSLTAAEFLKRHPPLL
jgi:hypothetical protein